MARYGQKYNYNIMAFENEDSLSYYLLGIYMTDGHIQYTKNNRVAIVTSKDEDWLELLKNIICPNKPLYKRNNAFSLDVSCTKICDWLIDHGCHPNKSLTIKFPNVPDEYLKDFIRGCWDGDGCICIYNAKGRKNPRKYSYLASASKEFIEKFAEVLLQKNIKCSFHTMKLCNSVIDGREIIAKNNLYKIHLSEKPTLDLINFMYYDRCLCMPRKYSKSLEIINIMK